MSQIGGHSPRKRPSWRGPYVWCFAGVASVFVPVLYDFGLVAFIVPALWGLTSSVRALVTGHFIQALVLLVYFLIYFSVFLALAVLTDWITRKIPWRGIRIAFRSTMLCGLFSCSFIRVLTYASIQGIGGEYSFWTAVERSIEKGRLR